jgi:hypothetical protein
MDHGHVPICRGDWSGAIPILGTWPRRIPFRWFERMRKRSGGNARIRASHDLASGEKASLSSREALEHAAQGRRNPRRLSSRPTSPRRCSWRQQMGRGGSGRGASAHAVARAMRTRNRGSGALRAGRDCREGHRRERIGRGGHYREALALAEEIGTRPLVASVTWLSPRSAASVVSLERAENTSPSHRRCSRSWACRPGRRGRRRRREEADRLAGAQGTAPA